MCCIINNCDILCIIFYVWRNISKGVETCCHCACAVTCIIVDHILLPLYILHARKWNDRLIIHRFSKPWYCLLVLPADPQAYNVKSMSDSVPTIQVDLASPQSPDSVSVMDEFTRAGQQQRQRQEEEQGLMMKPPSGPSGPNKPGEADGCREQQKLTRCLSDPGPSADEDEDEPFLPW